MGIATPIGRFQFVLGREIGISFYGIQNTSDAIFIPDNSNSFFYLLEYQSTKFEFPFLEYRPFRMFSKDQSSSIIVQFSGGVDVPHVTKVLVPADSPAPDLKSVWNIGLRITFNWRHYFD